MQKCAALLALGPIDRLEGPWMITTGFFIVTDDSTVRINAETTIFADIAPPRKEPIQVDY